MGDVTIGVDVARFRDATAIVIAERTFRTVPASDVLPERQESLHVVRHIETMERAPFMQQAERIIALAENVEDYADQDSLLRVLIEMNNSGSAVKELCASGLAVKAYRFKLVSITTTSSTSDKPQRDPKQPGGWLVGKQFLIGGLQVLVEQDRIRLPLIAQAEALKDELKNYGQRVTDAGNIATAARGSGFDDRVMALAFAVLETARRDTAPLSASGLLAANADGWQRPYFRDSNVWT